MPDTVTLWPGVGVLKESVGVSAGVVVETAVVEMALGGTMESREWRAMMGC